MSLQRQYKRERERENILHENNDREREQLSQSDYIVILKIFRSSSKTLNIVTGSRVPLGRRRWSVCGGWGYHWNQTNTPTPATVFSCSSQEVIYNYEVHRSLLHMRGLVLHRGRAQRSLGYSHYLDYIWLIITV